MTSKTISEQLTVLIKAIIKDWTYPNGQELSLKERKELVAQLKKTTIDNTDVNEAMIITDAFYKDKVIKEFRSMDTNFSWIFEIMQHELVSASRLHALLLDLAHEEHFSSEGIEKINHYFVESSDFGNNDNFITMSSLDVLDSLGRTKTFQLPPKPKENNADKVAESKHRPRAVKKRTHSDKIIKLKDY